MNPEKYYKETVLIRQWCFEVNKFILSKSQTKVPDNVSDDNFFFPPLPNKLNSQILRGYREAKRDMCNWASDLPQNEQIELNQILKEKFGEGLFENQSRQKNLINKIVKSGLIKSDEQYRLIEQTVSDLSQTRPDAEEIKIMNLLLTNYHNSAK